MRNTIKTSIITFSCILLLSVVFFQIIFSIFLSESYYTNLKKFHAETLFANLKNNYSDDETIIREITQYAENAYNMDIQIFSDDGWIYRNRSTLGNFAGSISGEISRGIRPFQFNRNNFNAYSDEPKANVQTRPEMPRIPNRLNIPNMPQLNTENIVLTGKFEYNGANRYIRISSPVESIDESVRTLTIVNTFISVFILIAGIIGAIIFAGKFSRPIYNIQEVAKNVALLNFETRANENLSTAELRELSVSINTMADKLHDLISGLQSSNEKLRSDVDYQKRLDKMRREFVANVSHELKTPLHLLLMYTENLKNNIDGIDKNYYCDTIIEETNRLNDMVKSLLDLSAIENGLAKMNKELFNLSDFSESVISKLALLFEHLKVSVSIEKEIYVEGDKGYTGQVIKNYLLNAVSHTPDNGRISIELRQQENSAVFSVFNEGSAIAESDIPQIWESFYKTDKARTRTEENHSGLGLYIVKTIITAHGGEYGVKNIAQLKQYAGNEEHAESGVVFWFSLTLAADGSRTRVTSLGS